MGRAGGVGGGAPAVLATIGGAGAAARGTRTDRGSGSRSSRTGQTRPGGERREGPAPAYPARAPQAQPAAVGACLHSPGAAAVTRAVPVLRRGVPRSGGALEAGGLLHALSAFLLPSPCCAGSRRSNSLTPRPGSNSLTPRPDTQTGAMAPARREHHPRITGSHDMPVNHGGSRTPG